MIFRIVKVFLCVGLLLSSLTSLSAQNNIIAALNFDPAKNGFGFPNYRNKGYNWEDDIGKDDLIRMFGVEAPCKSGNSSASCVLKADAQTWMQKKLVAMNIGHCEGIAVACLRLYSGMPFKGRQSVSNFLSGAKSPSDLRLDQTLENYIAYYWITQDFREISNATVANSKKSPVELVQMLIDSMTKGGETYTLGIWKSGKRTGNRQDGHAVVPFRIEDAGTFFKIHVYDNEFPKQTRYLTVNKTGNQQWTYSRDAIQKAKSEYTGNTGTHTLELTPTSARDMRGGKCFDSTFAYDNDRAIGCDDQTASLIQPVFTNASFRGNAFARDQDGEDAEFFLTGEGNMLVTDASGRRVGYDPDTNRFYDTIPNCVLTSKIGGFGIDLPDYYLPYEDIDGYYTVVFSGNDLDAESEFDFVFSAPGFTVGFNGIRLDPNEKLTAKISYDGEEIKFTASADGETPEVFYSFDPENNKDFSYLTEIGGVQLTAKKSLTYNFDFENGKLFFSDNDGNEDSYDIELIRLNYNGSKQEYTKNNLDIGKADRYEMDFGDWDGEGDSMCFKDDEDGDGFGGDEECDNQPNEKPR